MLTELFAISVLRKRADVNCMNAGFWIRKELDYAYELLSHVFRQIHCQLSALDTSKTDRFNKPQPRKLLPAGLIAMCQTAVLNCTARIKAIEAVMVGEGHLKKEDWDLLRLKTMDDMQKVNRCEDRFYQVHQVLDLGMEIRMESSGATFQYRVDSSSSYIPISVQKPKHIDG